MLFSSIVFLFIFLPTLIFVYYVSPRKIRNLVLLIFSLFFYGYGEPKYLTIMLLSITLNYIMGFLVHRYRKKTTLSHFIILLATIMNISILGYYKYANFILENINNIFNTSYNILEIVMPIGISFFTFQGLSYVIDVYKGQGEVQKNPLNVALYISLFPQLIAGPIVRYETVSEQINNRKETLEGFTYGIERFILGLSKKVLIANTVGLVADEIFSINPGEMSILLSWIGIISYTLQIYFDFSGYSDMAIGLGRIFGFKFLENFNYPYISRNITEFWRRWHISLGTWFRDYVYIPLGGNRVKTYRFLTNIVIVWFLTGLWHGAAWNFIIWGLYYGLILIIEKMFLGKIIENLPRFFQHIYTMILVVIGWLIFRTETISYGKDYLLTMFGFGNEVFVDSKSIYYILEYRFAFIVGILGSMPIYPYINRKFKNINTKWIRVLFIDYMKSLLLIFLFLLSVMYLLTSTFNPFIYFRF